MKDITIIGAGLSGSLLVMNLLRQETNERVNIRLIDRSPGSDLGPAYSTNEDHLLNVPAELMGAFSSDPEHFLKWALKKNIQAGKGDYLPRKLYREYIHSMVQEAHDSKNNKISVERVQGEAVDLKVINRRPVVYMEDGREYNTDKVVLALGNAPPRHPVALNQMFIEDKRYIRNPWDPGLLENLLPDTTIVFIGTGQTTVDLAAGLFRRKHRGQMISISRHGLFPLVQKKIDPYSSFYDELQGHTDIPSVFRIVRKHFRIAEEKGLDPRSVIDSLRPYTKAIWMAFPPEEKQRFLRHVFRYWEIIRSRIPPATKEIINDLISIGQLKVLTGRITDIVPSEKNIIIHYKEKGTGKGRLVPADVVINCIGPCQDYDLIDQPFIRNIIRSGLIQSDPAHLGINALPDGTIINADSTPPGILYTIGLPLKGIVWESLAAPEIRLEAEELARMLVKTG